MSSRVDQLLEQERGNFDQGAKNLLNKEITNEEVQRILGLMMILATDQETGKAMAAELSVEWLFTKEFIDTSYEITKEVALLSREEYGEYSTKSAIQYAESVAILQPAIEKKMQEIITKLNMPNLLQFIK